MRRNAKVAVVGVAVVILLVFFSAPVLPASHSYTSETVCPASTQLCSIGNNGLNLRGYGSVTYLLFGVGGWWETSNGYSVFSSYSSHQVLRTSPKWTTVAISLQNFALCPSNCIYPSPHLSGAILVNASSPLSSLHLLVNGTDEGSFSINSNMTHYIYEYKGGFQNPAVISGKTYWIEFIAMFKDNSTASASTSVVAGPVPEG